MLANGQLQHLAKRQAVEVGRGQSGGKMPDLPQAVPKHGADLLKFLGIWLLRSKERMQGIKPQERQADELRRAVMKVSAQAAQKAFARFDRRSSGIERRRALRFDRLRCSRASAE